MLNTPENTLIFEAYMNSKANNWGFPRTTPQPKDWKINVEEFKQHYIDAIGDSSELQKAFQSVLTIATDLDSANLLLKKYGYTDFMPFVNGKLRDS